MKRIFMTGISTEVGKTIASAIVVEALQADYWKPVQAGDLDNSDSHKIAELISNERSFIHPNSYALKHAMSPHAAASLEGRSIDLANIRIPHTDNHLVIEGAGGILVPLNDSNTILDLIDPGYQVIVVSKHYLGSINHSLLTIGLLQDKGFNVSVIFNGHQNAATESIIARMTGVHVLGRIDEEDFFDKERVKEYAGIFSQALQSL